MDDQNRNLLLATALSFVVILVWFIMFPPPEPDQMQADQVQAEQTLTPTAPTAQTAATTAGTTAAAALETQRVDIDTPRLSGSIALTGGRIDTLSLKDYRQSLDDGAPIVQMLRPVGDGDAYYALHGWAPGAGVAAADVPGPATPWQAQAGAKLTPDAPLTLRWRSPAGLDYTRVISVDDDFMFTIAQSVTNTTGAPITLAPYGILARHGEPQGLKKFFILHEGIVGLADDTLSEMDYKDLRDMAFDPAEGARAEVTRVQQNGWIGFTDHFWMSTLIPTPGSAFKSVVKYDEARDIYQTEAVMPTQTVDPGQSVTVTSSLFAGAKEWDSIRHYENNPSLVESLLYGSKTDPNRPQIERFLDAIDWGWFFFLTKPIFAVLHFLNVTFAAWGIPGAMGWAIIGLTLLIKAILFPLAYKSYASMAKMKELQPQMEKIKERAGDDRMKLQQEMMALYKKEKVNPAAGCLPILMQIPIFFSLYKVIFVTLELRHAPWIGWITDLSAPDPSSILNLFGLLPYSTPSPDSFFFIFSLGVLPILLGISMWMQQKLNPAPTDKTQAMVFAWMPWVFMFMLGSFASGLVIYWIANNTITFIQQYTIMRSHGYKPDVFGNILTSLRLRAKTDGGKS